jgi:hypothetical protein
LHRSDTTHTHQLARDRIRDVLARAKSIVECWHEQDCAAITQVEIGNVGADRDEASKEYDVSGDLLIVNGSLALILDHSLMVAEVVDDDGRLFFGLHLGEGVAFSVLMFGQRLQGETILLIFVWNQRRTVAVPKELEVPGKRKSLRA